MAVNYFVQNRDLEELSSNWKLNPEFAAFISEFPENDYYTIKQLTYDFFTRAKDRHAKHVDQW